MSSNELHKRMYVEEPKPTTQFPPFPYTKSYAVRDGALTEIKVIYLASSSCWGDLSPKPERCCGQHAITYYPERDPKVWKAGCERCQISTGYHKSFGALLEEWNSLVVAMRVVDDL